MGNKNSGPRPRPTALTLLRGNPGKRPLNPAEPTPPPGPVEMPPGLSPGARQVWTTIAPCCLAMGTLTPVDVTAFVGMCELVALRETIPKTRKNLPVLLPLYRELRPQMAQFGLDPSSRSRIQVAPQQAPADKWAGLL